MQIGQDADVEDDLINMRDKEVARVRKMAVDHKRKISKVQRASEEECACACVSMNLKGGYVRACVRACVSVCLCAHARACVCVRV